MGKGGKVKRVTPKDSNVNHASVSPSGGSDLESPRKKAQERQERATEILNQTSMRKIMR